MKRIGVAAVGDVLDINCWSNIPYFFFQAGLAAGYFNEPWSVDLHQFGNSRKLWNLKQIVLGKGKGGYQYSQSFLEKAEAQILINYFSSVVISFNQVFPRANSIINSGGKIYYYIDSTLHDLFEDDHYGISIPRSIKLRALAQEQDNYNKAEGVISMGTWVSDSLVNYYNIPPAKIFHVLPGANVNLPDHFKLKKHSPGAGISRDLILGFVGKDWKRKGLLFLLAVRDLLTERGYKVQVKAMGNCPDELIKREGLIYTGMINKQDETNKFIDVISSCDVGCLFSASEALGISTLEFLRIGIPVAGFFYKGLKDTLVDGASLRFEISASVTEVADRLEKMINCDELYALTERAQRYSHHVKWENTIEKIMKIISGDL